MGKQNIGRNRALLASVCEAAEDRLLAPSGELLIALDGGQAGTAPDLPSGGEDDAWKRSWQLDVAAAEAGLLVAAVEPFETFYETRGHRGLGGADARVREVQKARAFTPRDACVYVLARADELQAPAASAAAFVFEARSQRRRRVAATPRLRRGYFVETGRGDATWIFCGDGSRRRRDVDILWRRVAAATRRGYSVETSRGDAAAATWLFRGDESPRRRDVAILLRQIAATPRLRRGDESPRLRRGSSV